ncbi:TPA: hypothetical protein LA460_000125 [Clostridium botulinum]|nr:hypothetical protein [Clostridium botulinum]HBJ1652730.1 hypothetical protein [Clostridium botulinum]
MPNDELIQAIKSYYNNDLKITTEEINELIGKILNNPRNFTYNLSRELEEFCNKENICSNCGTELKTTTYDEYRGEYLGKYSFERVTYNKCPNCGLEE